MGAIKAGAGMGPYAASKTEAASAVMGALIRVGRTHMSAPYFIPSVRKVAVDGWFFAPPSKFRSPI